MIQIIVHAFADAAEAVVEVLYASSNPAAIDSKLSDLQAQFPSDYLAVYDLPLDCDLGSLPHYPSVAIHPDDFQ